MGKRFGLLWLTTLAAFALLCGPGPYRSSASADVGADQQGMLLPMTVKGYNFGPGEVSGRVIDAATGGGLAGVSICFNPQDCAVTLQDGSYTATSFPGDRQVTASISGYYPVIKDVFVIGGDTVQLKFALSPEITGGNIKLRAVLTWDSIPYWPPDQAENDLDAHLWLDAILPVHVFYDSKGDCTNYPNACLETDFRTGFGPETVAVRQFEPDTVYHFGVLNYNQGVYGVPLIRDTRAHVDVYDETGRVASYDVASYQGDGNFWYVFTYSYSSQQAKWVLTPENCIAFYSNNIQDIVTQCQ